MIGLGERKNNRHHRWFHSLLAVFILTGQNQALAEPLTVWKLTQYEDQMGHFDLYVAQDAVKVISLDWGYIVLARAPDWTVHCYRPGSKIEWQGTVKEFSGVMLNNPFEQAVDNREPNIRVGGGIFKGLKYTRFSPNKSSLNALYGADDIAVSPVASLFIARFWDLPNLGRVPIYRCRYLTHERKHNETWVSNDAYGDQRHGLVIELNTSAWSKRPYKACDFAPPAGYKRLNRVSDVAYTSKQKDKLNDMFGGYEEGDKAEPGEANTSKKQKY